jgi:hypothetical protein
MRKSKQQQPAEEKLPRFTRADIATFRRDIAKLMHGNDVVILTRRNYVCGALFTTSSEPIYALARIAPEIRKSVAQIEEILSHLSES